MQSQMQNFRKSTIYSSLINTDVRDIPVAIDNMFQDSTTVPIATQLTTLPTQLNMNESQALNIQAMTPRMQDCYQIPPHTSSLTQAQITDVMRNEYSFFYAPCNDFQMYHIICKEIFFNFESVSQLLSNTDDISMNNYAQSNNIFVFYHEQPEIKKIYQVTCEMVSHTFLFQYLNRIIYNIQFVNCEHQQQEFSNSHRENLKFHLKKDLIHYLMPRNFYKNNYNEHERFVQDYHFYASMINSNTHIPSNNYNTNTLLPFDQSYNFQQNNNCRSQNNDRNISLSNDNHPLQESTNIQENTTNTDTTTNDFNKLNEIFKAENYTFNKYQYT
ncbi:hypothetical protein RclHR1_01610015 [Rhizophagus clarus]|uniref:Uncharacterized protein n=1 Tax=Rhizophagus clarus TaxID=94130 RepID=A0A2Z6QW02_9GLOM|nr:hypothetical protein RclHR1_01610015 [Rhizophagus clarus]GES98078.1 hypothetical protein GLOIN_2v1471944 [Rhizophagus clarus]